MRSGGRPGVLRVIVADANVLLSAASGKAAGKAFLAPIEIYTTAHTAQEVFKYIPLFAARYGFTVEEVQREFLELPLEVKDRPFYLDRVPRAKQLMEDVDPDDVDLVALALKLDASIWSNDDHFKDLPLKRYTTAQLLKALGI